MNASTDEELASSSIAELPTPKNFCAFVPYACAQYGAPFYVKINVETQAEYIRADDKKKPRSHRPRDVQGRTSKQAATVEEQESEDPRQMDSERKLIVFKAVKDHAGDLVELIFDRCGEIPVMLIQVIAMCIPYQPKLRKLTVLRTPLLCIIIYEFSKFVSQLTEVCLDGSPLAGRNHGLLLAAPTRLYCLSLARCKLDDTDCAQLAELLRPPHAAAYSLHVLQLSANRIGDEGARALAHTLRTNRGLHYLNLAGNRITDSGAISILEILMEFPLTKGESKSKSLRHIQFLRRRAEEYANIIKELTKDKSIINVGTSKRIKPFRGLKTDPVFSTVDALVQRANIMTDKLVGTFVDPFTSDKTVVRDGTRYCLGNMALCALNLSYNDLQYTSITCLWKVLKQQYDMVLPAPSEPGLLRVRVDGNSLPHECEPLQCVDELLERATARISRLVPGARAYHGPRVNNKPKSSSSRLAMPHKSPSV